MYPANGCSAGVHFNQRGDREYETLGINRADARIVIHIRIQEAEMEETTLHAPDIECDGCANSIKRAVGRLHGIESVEVNVDAKDVTVRFDENLLNQTQIVLVLDQAGFPVANI
jgi:copper chaperone